MGKYPINPRVDLFYTSLSGQSGMWKFNSLPEEHHENFEQFLNDFQSVTGLMPAFSFLSRLDEELRRQKGSHKELKAYVSLLLNELDQLPPWQLAFMQELPEVKENVLGLEEKLRKKQIQSSDVCYLHELIASVRVDLSSLPTIGSTPILLMKLSSEGKIEKPTEKQKMALGVVIARIKETGPYFFDEVLTYTQAIAICKTPQDARGLSNLFGLTRLDKDYKFDKLTPDIVDEIAGAVIHENEQSKFSRAYISADLFKERSNLDFPFCTELSGHSKKPIDYFSELAAYIKSVKLYIVLGVNKPNTDQKAVCANAVNFLKRVKDELVTPLEYLEKNSKLTDKGKDLLTSYKRELARISKKLKEFLT